MNGAEFDATGNTIQVVFFDAAGTLLRVRGSVGTIYSRIARNHGVQADAGEVEQAFRAAFHARSQEGLTPERTGLEAEKAWWMDVVRQVFSKKMPPEVLAEYFEDVFETFRTAEAWELYPDTIECLERLRGRCRMALISNFDSRLFDVLAGLKIDSYFEQVILSWHVGAAKPDPILFRRALEIMQIKAGDAIHVGDSPTEDAAGARAAGMCGVLLDREGKHAGWSGPRVKDLRELLSDFGQKIPEPRA